MHVVAIICQNGLGHFRRSVGVLSRLAERLPDIRLTVFCEDWQLSRTSDWGRSQSLFSGRATAVTGLLGPAVRQERDPTAYRDGRLLNWETRLAGHPALADATLVVSDNLAGILSVRPDAVLLGSFLWSDVLAAQYPHHPAVAAFVAHEQALLARYRPPMICVDDLAMPAVRRWTRAVGVPWMCESLPSAPAADSGGTVAFLAGASGLGSQVLTDAAALMLDEGCRVALPADLRSLLPPPTAARCEHFLYSSEAYEALSLVVCRPGVGTLTDCLAHRLPVLAVADPGNPEMRHNAARIDALGFGRAAPPDCDAADLVTLARNLLAPTARSACVAAMAAAATNGLDVAAHLLTSWCNGGVPADLSTINEHEP